MIDKQIFNQVKQQFFAMRNGAVAEQMRTRGLNYKLNLGLNLPQVAEIAQEYSARLGSDEDRAELAQMLWDNEGTRCSRLMAPMLMPPAMMDADRALRWALEAQTTEVADVLCHRLLRHLTFAPSLADRLVNMPLEMPHYTGLRLVLNLLLLNRYPAPQAKALADAETLRHNHYTRGLALQLAQEADFALS